MWCVSRWGGCIAAISAPVRCYRVPVATGLHLCRGRCPHRPCFWNSSTIALNHHTRTAKVRRVPSSTSALRASGHATSCRTTQRRARCGLASLNYGCHPPALISGK
jgi:hypothetical protein